MQQAPREHEEAEESLSAIDADIDEEPSDVTKDDRPEPQGVADADDLLLAQIEDGSEDLGLDVETGVEGGLDPTAMVDDTEDEAARDDEQGVALSAEELGSGIDGGDEDGWMKDSEGDAELYQSDFSDDDPELHADDGGLEGTEAVHGAEDPLHDGLDDDALPPLHADEGDDTLIDEIEPDLLREISSHE